MAEALSKERKENHLKTYHSKSTGGGHGEKDMGGNVLIRKFEEFWRCDAVLRSLATG